MMQFLGKRDPTTKNGEHPTTPASPDLPGIACCYMNKLLSSIVVVLLSFISAPIIPIKGLPTASLAPMSASRIAVGQLRTTNSKIKSLIDAGCCARLAKEHGAVMLFLPENFGFMGKSTEETIEQAESMAKIKANSPTVTQAIRETLAPSYVTQKMSCISTSGSTNDSISLLDGLKTIAVESGLWISACMHTAGAPPSAVGTSRIYNTHFILDASGMIQAHYHKIHLFDVAITDQVELRESASTAPGSQVVVCDSPIGRLGLSTCYDIRFPQLYAELVDKGAQILLVPAAFTPVTGRAHWHLLLRARAAETQCYVVAAAQYGVHNERRISYGHSLVVDPWGVVLADAGGMDSSLDAAAADVPEPPSVFCCDIDVEKLHLVRQRMPVQKHRANANYK
ncbi:hypothetical protein MPSEU_000514100 [Mayamaea pseudoterrestris]|nr:hypothetical protein MPSEU_000514100 [Mayamaea pseudoterrestris]